MAPVDQLTGAVENRPPEPQKTRTSSPAPRKSVDASEGGSNTLVEKNPAETDPKEATSGSSKTQGARMLGLMLGMVIVLGMGVHFFFGFEGALKQHHKSMGIVICCLVGLVTATFFGKRVMAMRKKKAP